MKKSEPTSLHSKIMVALSSFAALVAIAAVFGYSFGKDMALRDNARDAAAAKSQKELSGQ